MTNETDLTVQLNNRGVVHLEKGNFARSFSLFRDALRNTMANLREESIASTATTTISTVTSPCEMSSMSNGLENNTHSTDENPRQVWKCKGMEAFSRSKSTRRSLSFGIADADYVFSHGIALMEEVDAYSPSRLVNVTVTSSIVLFNLALIHHKKGLLANSSRYLVKAESFYQKSFFLLAETGLTLGHTGNPVVDFVAMALLNNAAQVGRELCHYEQANQNFRELLAIALRVNAADYADCVTVAKFIDETKMFFLLNAMCLSEQALAAAA